MFSNFYYQGKIMFNFIIDAFKVHNRVHPKSTHLEKKVNIIISYLSNGNILLQDAKYQTESDISTKKSNLFSYFLK